MFCKREQNVRKVKNKKRVNIKTVNKTIITDLYENNNTTKYKKEEALSNDTFFFKEIPFLILRQKQTNKIVSKNTS